MQNIIKIVFVIIGSFIGAGFASGKEVYTFFIKYENSMIGIIFSCVLIAIIIAKSIKIIKEKNIDTYMEFLDNIIKIKKREKIKYIVYKIVNIFTLITFYIMISAFSAYINQQYGINKLIGSIIAATFVYIVLAKNKERVLSVNKILVPMIIIVITIVGVVQISNDYNNQVCFEFSEISFMSLFPLTLNGLLYVSYNCILLIPIIISLKEYIIKIKSTNLVGIISGIIILFLMTIISLILLMTQKNISYSDMPIIYILKENNILVNVYGVIILSSIFTTAISLGMSFLNKNIKNITTYTQSVILMCISSVLFSQIGFSNLINIIYPAFGILGILQLYRILIYRN